MGGILMVLGLLIASHWWYWKDRSDLTFTIASCMWAWLVLVVIAVFTTGWFHDWIVIIVALVGMGFLGFYNKKPDVVRKKGHEWVKKHIISKIE